MSKRSLCAVWMVFGFWMGTTAELATAGPVDDCNQNGVPDSEDLLTPEFGDCNNNGVLDICDVDPTDPDGDGRVYIDRNGNGRPDECDLGGRLVGPGVEINPRTGHATKLPPPPGVSPEDDPQWIAFSPDGTLYGLRNQRLYVIDRENWTTTDVANLDQPVVSPTFAPDGTLFAMFAQPSGWPSRDLVTVNILNGAVTFFGALTDLPSVAAIAFAADGTLHALDGRFYHWHLGLTSIPLFSVDLATMSAVPVQYFPAELWGSYCQGLSFDANGVPHISTTNYYTELGSSTYARIPGFIFPFSSGPRSLAFGPDDIFYAVSIRGLYDVRNREYLVSRFNLDDYAGRGSELYSAGKEYNRIDVDTGKVSPRSTFGQGDSNPFARGITFCSQQSVKIIDESGFILFSVGGNYYGASGSYALVCVDGQVFGVTRSTGVVLTFEFIDKGTYFNNTHDTQVSTLTAPVTNLALGPHGTVYGVDGVLLVKVDLFTGHVLPIGPLGMEVTNVAYVAARVDPRDVAPCVQGPEIAAGDECTKYDFDGDGSVDLRDLSGLWLIDQR